MELAEPRRRDMIEARRRHGHFDPRWHTNEHALLSAVAGDDDPFLHSWENEGGSYSMTNAPALEVDGCEEPPAGLEWYAFLSRYFPGRRRHDFEVLKAYEAYRSATDAPSSSHRSHTAPRGGRHRRDVTRGRAHPHARSPGIPRIEAGNSATVVGRVPIASVS